MLSEQLTAQFYDWERRGRGWQVWAERVALEPAYRPFLRYYKPQGEVHDDGRRHTALSGLIEGAKKAFSPQPKPQPDDSADIEAYLDLIYPSEPEAHPTEDEIEELSIVLPSEAKFTIEQAEQFVLSLTSIPYPISFEIIGTGSSILFQIACPKNYATQVKNLLRTYFPASVTESETSLQRLLSKPPHPVIVDFGLSEEFVRPIKMVKKLEPDPLQPILATLEGLSQGEIGVVQVLFQATRHSWSESILRAVSDGQGGSFFDDAPDMLPLAREKILKPIFASTVRVLGSGASQDRSWEIARGLGFGILHLNEPMSNEFIPLKNSSISDKDHLADIVVRQTHRSGMLLNSGELVGLVHPPSSSIYSEKIARHNKVTRLAPKHTGESHYVLGTNEHSGTTRTVSLTDQQRLKHVHIIGSTGTGKSTLLKNLIMQDIRNGCGVAVIDPHGDLIDDILGLVPEERFEDIVLFDPADLQNRFGINILSAKSEFEKDVASSDLVALFRRYSSSWGDQMTSVLGNAIQAFLESDQSSNLSDLRRFLLEKDFRAHFLESVGDPDIIYYWKHSFPLLKGNAQASIVTRLDSFLRPKLLRAVITQKAEIDFGQVMSGRKILLAKLSQGLIGTENSTMLGSLLVSKLHQAALARQDHRTPFYLYIDEFQNFVTPSLASVLSGARKFGLGLILAHQELRQISSQDSEVAESVISNPATRICFRLGDTDARKLRDGFSHFDTSDLQNLNVGEAIGRIERSDNDFNLEITLPDNIDSQIVENRRKILVSLSKSTKPTPDPIKVETNTTHVQEVYRPAPRVTAPPITEPHKDTPVPTKTTETIPLPVRRDTSQHRYLQSLVKNLGESKGYKAVLEAPTADGQGRVDVALTKENERIAVEISVSTESEHELQNIKKCLSDGYQTVIVCSVEKRQLDKISKLVEKGLKTEEVQKVQCCQPEDLILLFSNIDTVTPETETTSQTKGYRVKVNYSTDADQGKRRDEITQVIARSVQRLKKQE